MNSISESGDPLELGLVTHSSTLAWRIQWRSLVGESIGSQRDGHYWSDIAYTQYSIIYIFHTIFIHLSVDGDLNFIGNCKLLLWTSDYIYLFELVFLFFSAVYLLVDLLGNTVVPPLVFWEPINISNNSVRGFLFSHNPSNICYLFIWWESFWYMWMISHGFVAVPGWLATLNIFLCVCWSSALPLWKRTYLLGSSAHFFKCYDW